MNNLVVGFLAFCSVLLSTTDAHAGSISGTVTGPDGTPSLEDIYVVACVVNDKGRLEWGSATYTDAAGHFEIAGLVAGNYRVCFRDGTGDYAPEVYNNIPGDKIWTTGTLIGVEAGETTAGIDASLALSGKIAGRVTGPDGTTPLEGIYVASFNPSGNVYGPSAYTDADGHYEIDGLWADNYRVYFSDDAGNYVPELYDDLSEKNVWNIGILVGVAAGATTSNINASLAMAGKIAGRVTGPDGTTPLEGIHVQWYRPSDLRWGPVVYTDANGRYEIGALAADDYRVSFRDFNGSYRPEAFDNIPGDNLWDYGARISVAAGATTADINASLAEGGIISGTVTGPDGTTPLGDIQILLFSRNSGGGWEYFTDDFTDIDGDYEFVDLESGIYRVQFNGNGYIMETYDNATHLDSGADVAVLFGETTGGIDASLVMESRISGTVTGPGAEALANVEVEASRWEGESWIWKGGARTDADGHYEIGELPAGTYRLDFNPGGNYVPGSLDDVTLVAESVSANNDIALLAYARLSGTVFLADGVTTVGGVRVYLRNDSGDMVWRQSGADGSYAFSGLRPGNYSVVAAPSASLGLLGEWYDDDGLYVTGQDTPPPEAEVIELDYGDVQTGIDFDLDPAGRISGAVTDEGGAPLAGACVKAKNSTHGLICMAQTDDAGTYELIGLLPGDYQLKAGAEDYRDEWWVDATHEDLATPIAVASGSDLARDFVLLTGQNPALVEIVSDPSGAAIYLDYQATSFVTPALVDVGEVASHAPRMGGWAVASHVVTLKKDGHSRPAPQVLPAVEAETVSITIDMTSAAEGSLSAVTDPADAEVYVDCADVADGLTPLVVGSLAPGSHTLLLKKTGYLQARPIVAHVEAGATNEIVVPLAPVFSPDRIMAEVQSSPTGATIYVDYFPTTDITDAVIDWMDPASHSGSGWHSASHTVMLRKLQKLPGAPRYVPDATNAVQTNLVRLIVDVAATADDDGDGLPDSWEPDEDEYPGWGGQGPDDDYDGDGVSNFGELIAGTHPGNPDSTFEIDEGDLSSPGNNDSFTLMFSSVPGRMYFIRGKTSMSPNAEWINLTGIIVATGFETTCAVQFPEGENMRFFQLVVWNP